MTGTKLKVLTLSPRTGSWLAGWQEPWVMCVVVDVKGTAGEKLAGTNYSRVVRAGMPQCKLSGCAVDLQARQLQSAGREADLFPPSVVPPRTIATHVRK